MPLLLELASQSFSKALAVKFRPKSIADLASKNGQDLIPDIDQAIEETTAQIARLNTSGESDGEPLLGNWLENIFASVPQSIDAGDYSPTGRKRMSLDLARVANKMDHTLYANHAVNCLNSLNDFLFSGLYQEEDFSDQSFGFEWGEHEMTLIAGMFRLVEANESSFASKHQNFIAFTNSFDSSLHDFNYALIRLTHSLLASGRLSGKDEVSLLAKLNVFIGNDLKDEWPLAFSPRMLGLLGQILLPRTSAPDSDQKLSKDLVIMNIWERFVRTLCSKINEPNNIVDFVDVTAEHLQLLVLLFHSLSLMQKKTVFVNVMSSISNFTAKCVELMGADNDQMTGSCQTLSHFSRLLLIFDYLIRYLYEPPPGLLDQVKHNVFSDPAEKRAKLSSTFGQRAYFECADLEEAYRSMAPYGFQCKMRPLFYNLAPDVPSTGRIKLDGLASSFMLNYDKYSEFYDGLCCLSTRGVDVSRPIHDSSQAAFCYNFCAYTWRLIFRILGLLPPPVNLVIQLKDLEPQKIRLEHLPMVLRLGGRLMETAHLNWLKDGLCKQKMLTDEAENLTAAVKARFSSEEFQMQVCESALELELNLCQSGSISVGGLMLVDHVIMHLYTILSKQSDQEEMQIGSGDKFNSLVHLMEKFASILNKLAKTLIIERAARSAASDLVDPPPHVDHWRHFARLLIDLGALPSTLNSLPPTASFSPSPSTPTLTSESFAPAPLASSSSASPSSRLTVACWPFVDPSVQAIFDADWFIDADDGLSSRGLWTFARIVVEADAAKSKSQAEVDLSTLVAPSSDALYDAHLKAIGIGPTILATVQRLLYSSVSQMLFLIKTFHPSTADLNFCDNALVPLLMDSTTKFLSSEIAKILNDSTLYGSPKADSLQTALSYRTCKICLELITNSRIGGPVSPEMLDAIGEYFHSLFEKSFGRKTVAKTFDKSNDIKALLNCLYIPKPEEKNPLQAMPLLIFEAANYHADEKELPALCEKIVVSLNDQFSEFENWLKSSMENSQSAKCVLFAPNAMQDFLNALVNYLRRSSINENCCSEFSKKLLIALIDSFDRILRRCLTFRSSVEFSCQLENLPDLFKILVSLASVQSTKGHIDLSKAVIQWLSFFDHALSSTDQSTVCSYLSDESLATPLFGSARALLDYLREWLGSFEPPAQRNEKFPVRIIYDSDMDESSTGRETEDMEDMTGGLEEDESADESDDDFALDNKMCTFTTTQKEFMNQHWYHCHTCGMVDGEGVCTVCAKVCHKGHDLSYSKFGSFFCDCGAKGACQAMAQRSKLRPPKSKLSDDSSKRKNVKLCRSVNFPGKSVKKSKAAPAQSAKKEGGSFDDQSTDFLGISTEPSRDESVFGSDHVIGYQDELKNQLISAKKIILESTLAILKRLGPVVSEMSEKSSSLGFAQKFRDDLQLFHSLPKTYENVESLVTAASSSQDFAFENMKLVLTGDVAQTLKHLIATHVIQRTALACLSSFDQKRQLLAVAHDKCKITVIHLTPLLKQADGNQKKLALSRCCSETLPFAVISVSANPQSGELLAVCGVKELNVLSISHAGIVNNRLVIQLPLDGGNYILRALWLPGSSTRLALVTADYVRIYDLASSCTNPIFHFMLAAGKICDATFVCWENKLQARSLDINLMLLSNSGHLYFQELDESSQFVLHGSLYVTSSVTLVHPEIEEKDGILSQGGCSLYFSPKLKTVFVSFASGKNVFFAFTKVEDCVKEINVINWRSSMKSLGTQPLYRWSECLDHPGLVTSLTHVTQNPLIFMLKPAEILMQQISNPSKSKVVDCCSVQYYSFQGEKRGAVISLSEDGNLRIFCVNRSQSDHWLPKQMAGSFLIPLERRRVKPKTSSNSEKLEPPPFQVEFFESCQQLTNVEFGGNDLLQVYNAQLLKDRLEKNNLYIACSKANGFKVEIHNNDNAMLICGLRIELGKRNLPKTPLYFEVFGRRQMVSLTRVRWYDFPFSRDETVTSNNRVTLSFGPSRDESKVNFVDSIKVYGMSRDAFGWSAGDDDRVMVGDELSALTTGDLLGLGPTNSPLAYQTPRSAFKRTCDRGPRDPPFLAATLGRQLSTGEQTIGAAFCVLQLCIDGFNASQAGVNKISAELLLPFLTSTLHPETLQRVKSVLRHLLTNRNEYYHQKDGYVLAFVSSKLSGTAPPIDPEIFSFLVALTRNIGVLRPTSINAGNLKIAKSHDFVELLMSTFWTLHAQIPIHSKYSPIGWCENSQNFYFLINALVEILHAFCLSDPSVVPTVVKAYVCLLLSKHVNIAYACRSALIAIFKKKVKSDLSSNPQWALDFAMPSSSSAGVSARTTPSVHYSSYRSASSSGGGQTAPPPVHLTTSSPSIGGATVAQPIAEEEEGDNEEDDDDGEDEEYDGRYDDEEIMDAYDLLQAQADLDESSVGDGAANGVPPDGDEQQVAAANAAAAAAARHILGLASANDEEAPEDVDDEQHLVDIAIALSLQDQHADQSGVEEPHSDHVYALVNRNEPAHQEDAGHSSDTSASAMSDDEGPNVAAEGSTLRISPTEGLQPSKVELHRESAESEILASGAESASGHSSNFSEKTAEVAASVLNKAEISLQQKSGPSLESDVKQKNQLVLSIVENFAKYLPELDKLNGVECISFLQILIALVGSMNFSQQEEKAAVSKLVQAFVDDLRFSDSGAENQCERSNTSEVRLLRLRFLSVFLAKGKGSSKTAALQNELFVASLIAKTLLDSGAICYCLRILKHLVKSLSISGSQNHQRSENLLQQRMDLPPPDFSPLFLPAYVKEHSADIFDCYPLLITEIAIRLPYQIMKIANISSATRSDQFGDDWNDVLCDLMRCDQTPYIRKQTRKLLLFICTTKDYRLLRDSHTLRYHMQSVKDVCSDFDEKFKDARSVDSVKKLNLTYATLNDVMDYLKSIVEIATCRPHSWQSFCVSDGGVLRYLVKLACAVDDNVASVVLSLVQMAFCVPMPVKDRKKSAQSPAKKDEKEKYKFSDALAIQIASTLLEDYKSAYFKQAVKYFLFSCNASECRWQMHSIVRSIFDKIDPFKKNELLCLFWEVFWPEMPLYGRKAAQFVDLLGYYTSKLMTVDEMQVKLLLVLALLKNQNELLNNHPNAYLYNALSSLLEFDGYYLETNPCLVCNNPEVTFMNMKLNSLKMDARYTTTSQMIKLLQSHEISRIVLKLSELRRSKTVRQIKLFYSNKVVPSAVELKNKPEIWCLAKTFSLTQSQAELKMEFAVPVVACNLMLEFSEFYEIPSATPETLHCPRCSAAVPANPGVCSNCNENVYQCHKCRSINYDEKDPFLCNTCGYSKYGKFDYTVYCRVVAGVEPIESEEDRKKTLIYVNAMLEKADQSYKQLLVSRPVIEQLLAATSGQETSVCLLEDAAASSTQPPAQAVANAAGHPPSRTYVEIVGGPAASGANAGVGLVNRNIQLLALKYNRDCRFSFEELSKIVQKLIANKNELLTYDQKQRELSGLRPIFPTHGSLQSSTDCFGCAAATAQQCILLVRAMTTSSVIRKAISNDTTLIDELVNVSFKQSSVRGRQAARELVCSVIRDQKFATQFVCETIEHRINKAIAENLSTPNMAYVVQSELQLLFSTLPMMDDCWSIRLKSLFKILLQSLDAGSSCIEAITLPCLIAIQSLFLKTSPEKAKNIASTTKVNIYTWLADDSGEFLYEDFKRRKITKSAKNAKAKKPPVAHPHRLMEKYGEKWLKFCKKEPNRRDWLDKLLFCLRSSQTRLCSSILLENLCTAQPMRKAILLDLMSRHLDNLESLGDRAQDFVRLYQNLIKPDEWKIYLVVRKILPKLSSLIQKSVEQLDGLEGRSLNTDMSQGYALKVFCDLLLSLMQVELIRKKHKKHLLGVVLHSFLGLKRLLIQRTKLIDDAQAKLLQLLELITTGTEAETEEFVKICILTAKKYPLDDLRTPMFIFERLNSIIFPEEKEVGEFLINVEKDVAQDDFLQGRMMGNPYKSSDVGMGPLMREIKNKICRDCDLISLLEDDTGMELLVNGKIISLDLSVSEVYKKIWQPNHAGEPMLIVYRMRGLLGDATEEFIETLQTGKSDKIDEEEIYKRSKIIGECGGLKLMLERLTDIKNVHINTVLPVILTLFDYCVRVTYNRIVLLDPKLRSVHILLSAAKPLLLSSEPDVITLGEKTLTIINRILSEIESIDEPSFEKFCNEASASRDDFQWLLSQIYEPHIQANTSLKECLLRTISNLTLGCKQLTSVLIDHFENSVKFEAYDVAKNKKIELDAFCYMVANVQATKYGERLKSNFQDAGFLAAATGYLTKKCPPLYKIGSTIDSPDWKEFLSKPSLKYVLRMLTGLCKNHEPTQLIVAEECIPIIHRLEQISSEERVGSLAENLMEVLRSNEKVAKKIEEVRDETKTKKRNLAMAMRQKQLNELGMKMSEKGQVRSDSSIIKKVVDVSEEPGLTCSICREGYKFMPQKLLGVYTFTKRCNCEEFEIGPRKTPAYSTVSHFNSIHFECHTAGVRSARGRDEWESALLQNANTRCNGLLPICGTQVLDSDYAAGLAKHNAYVQDYTGVNDINFTTSMHDLKLLLNRFAFETSFADETGGGGPESNAHLAPHLLAVACYLLTQTQAVDAQTARLSVFLNAPPETWARNSFECEGAVYFTTCALALLCKPNWDKQKLIFLKRLIVTAHVRGENPVDGSVRGIKDKSIKPFKTYKPYVILFSIVESIYNFIFKDLKIELSVDWPHAVFQYIRSNDWKVVEDSSRFLKFYQTDLLTCESFAELCDITGLLAEIPEPDAFLQSSLDAAPAV